MRSATPESRKSANDLADASMGIQQKLHTKLVQKLILTPSLQQAIKLLPMSTLELSDLLNQEMVENPMLEEVPTEELQPAEAAADRGEDRDRRSRPTRPTPGTTRTTSTSSATTSTTAIGRARRRRSKSCRRSRTRSRRASSLSDHLMWQLSMQTDDPLMREIGSAIIGNLDDDGYLVASFDELAAHGPVAGRRGRARAAAGPGLRSDRRRRARPAGVPAAAAPAPRARRHADREDRHRSSAAAAEPSGAGDRPQARADDRRPQGAHRDHPPPRSEAGQPLQPDAVAVRHSRRLRGEGRGSVRGGAERGRAAADADQPGLPPAARQGRPRTTTRRAPT